MTLIDRDRLLFQNVWREKNCSCTFSISIASKLQQYCQN